MLCTNSIRIIETIYQFMFRSMGPFLWNKFHFHCLKLTFSKINILNFLLEFNQHYWTIYQYMFQSKEPFSWNKNGFPFFKTNFLQNKCSKLFTGIKSRLLRQYINTCFDLWSLFHEIKIAFHSLKLTFSKINILNFLLEFNQDYWDNISIHVSVYGTLFMK